MSARHPASIHVVVMGVSATGKSTVAKALAEKLDLEFIEGDDFHSPANLEKMAKGEPLTDEDRLPWLRMLAGLVEQRGSRDSSTILTCSALRRSYRDTLREGVPGYSAFFVHLHAEFAVLLDRMGHRDRHFMPSSLLQSQFDTLEPLEPDESGIVIDVTPPLDDVLAAAAQAVSNLRSPH